MHCVMKCSRQACEVVQIRILPVMEAGLRGTKWLTQGHTTGQDLKSHCLIPKLLLLDAFHFKWENAGEFLILDLGST